MAASWIRKINKENSRQYKEKVLKDAAIMAELGDQSAERFLTGFRWCYSPMITFGIKHVDNTTGIVDAENPWDDFFLLLHHLLEKKIVGNEAKDAIKKMSHRFNSDEWNNYCAPVIRRDLKVGVGAVTINKVLGGKYKIPVFSCQLASDWQDRSMLKGKMRIEPKLDGIRMLLSVCAYEKWWNTKLKKVFLTAYSRNGKFFENFEHLEYQIDAVIEDLQKASPFREDFILDGEVTGISFQALLQQARKKKNIKTEDIVFNVFDIIPKRNFIEGHYNAPLYKRAELLKKLEPVFNKTKSFKLVPYIDVDFDTREGWEKYNSYVKKVLEDGYEGVMIKNLNAPYSCTRNRFWLKNKPTITVDLQVIGIQEGMGRNQGKLGALICYGVDQDREISVNVGNGFTDAERKEIWDNANSIMGNTVEVLADSITKNIDGTYSLRFPRFVRFRNDK
jgi:DNA ligase-1